MIDNCEGTENLPYTKISPDTVSHYPEDISHQHSTCTTNKDEEKLTVLKQIYLAINLFQLDTYRRLREMTSSLLY